jgi:hypothetical protein
MLVGTTLGGLILFLLLKEPAFARLLWGYGALSCITGFFSGSAARPLYLVWMGLAWGISSTIGLVALACVFFLVITPIGLAARLSGRDRLKLECLPCAPTYWEIAPPGGASRHDRQY